MDQQERSGPVAFRKHVPGLTNSRVSAARSRALTSMNQISKDDQPSICPRERTAKTWVFGLAGS
jgi:hypothetical protein